jgi:hypothetical protein
MLGSNIEWIEPPAADFCQVCGNKRSEKKCDCCDTAICMDCVSLETLSGDGVVGKCCVREVEAE